MESLVECPICMENYQESIRPPTTLECGHTMCIACANLQVKNGKITCPIDKQALVINSLNPNYEMLNLIEEANKTIMKKEEIQQIVEKAGKVTKENEEKINENCELRRIIKHLEDEHKIITKKNAKLMRDLNGQILNKKEMQQKINENYDLGQRIENLEFENQIINSEFSKLRCYANDQKIQRERM